MRMFRRVGLLAAAVGLAGSLIPLTAHATTEACGGGSDPSSLDLIVFSSTGTPLPDNPAGLKGAGTPSLNTNTFVCTVDSDDDIYDFRTITPGANRISVRLARAFDATVPSLAGTVDGLGFSNQAITLARSAAVDGSTVVYDTPSLYLADPTATGSVTVVVTLPNGSTVHTTYHTVN
jgi:hypothetical protein